MEEYNEDLCMIGQARQVLEMLVDTDSFEENKVGDAKFDGDFGPCAVVGTGKINGTVATFIANDAEAFNERFPVVFAGIIGIEEAYKMARSVYATIAADKNKPIDQKRPIVLIVDTPGNAPGKIEEIIGMNKATGAYQLALAEARNEGHAVIALVIGRAISGAFLCHGLQADHILALAKDFGTIIHVMPLTSISRITKMDIEHLEVLSRTNPVFASGVDFFYKLGGVNEIVNTLDDMKPLVSKHIHEVMSAKANNAHDAYLGPKGRGDLGLAREGRTHRDKTIKKMYEEYDAVIDNYIKA